MPQSAIINAAHTVVNVYRQFQGMRLTSRSIQGRHSFTQNNPNTPHMAMNMPLVRPSMERNVPV